jgi:phage shock protein PspC (stress-responsive transcriptional regulator)
MNDDTPIMDGPEENEPTAPQEAAGPPDEGPTRERAADGERARDEPQRRSGTDAGRPEQTEEHEDRPRRLLRSSSDRVLAGVAGGLGRYFGVDPVIFRIGFALSILFGGLGALAYLLLAVFVPTDGEPDATQRLGRRLKATGFWRAVGMIAVAVLAIGGLLGLAGGAAFAVALGWGVPTAIVIIVIGALLALAAFRGGARWLIAPAVALAVGGGVAAASDLDFRGGIGDRHYSPASVQSIPADGYRLGVGRLVVDLRDLNWLKHRVVDLRVSLGAGQANVFVPKGVCVVGSTHAGAGESEVVGEQNNGVDVDRAVGTGSVATPRLELDASVDVGQLRVVNSDTANVDTPGYGPGPLHVDLAPQRMAEAKACAAR